jgi:hypothetical protein
MCVCVCVRACVRACVCVRVCVMQPTPLDGEQVACNIYCRFLNDLLNSLRNNTSSYVILRAVKLARHPERRLNVVYPYSF